MKRLLLSALAALALAACATAPTVYGPAATADAAGYRSTKIETDRYRVSFRGNPDLKGPQVEDLALRRAAEITLADGYQWFRIVDRHTEQVGGRDRDRPRGGVGIGGGSGSYGSHTSVGLGLSFDLSPDSRKYETSMEILLGRGAKPGDADAYDAQSILDRPR
jgi:hypothetical protein